MAKVTVVRKMKNFVMYKRVARRRGRGCKFQWNAKSKYVITYADAKSKYVITYADEHYATKPTKVFNTLEEADKEWVYLTLRYS